MFGAENLFGSDSGLLKSLRLSASAMYYCTIALKALLKGCKKLGHFGLGSGHKNSVTGGFGFALLLEIYAKIYPYSYKCYTIHKEEQLICNYG